MREASPGPSVPTELVLPHQRPQPCSPGPSLPWSASGVLMAVLSPPRLAPDGLELGELCMVFPIDFLVCFTFDSFVLFLMPPFYCHVNW